MNRMMRAYLFRGGTVVLDKSTIMNATDEEFTEISLILSKDQIVEFYEELDEMGELEESEDDF